MKICHTKGNFSLSNPCYFVESQIWSCSIGLLLQNFSGLTTDLFSSGLCGFA